MNEKKNEKIKNGNKKWNFVDALQLRAEYLIAFSVNFSCVI